MTREEIAMVLWQEQISTMGDPREVASLDRLEDWMGNRTYPLEVLDEAAKGDVGALAIVRAEAGLPVFV